MMIIRTSVTTIFTIRTIALSMSYFIAITTNGSRQFITFIIGIIRLRFFPIFCCNGYICVITNLENALRKQIFHEVFHASMKLHGECQVTHIKQ